MKIKILYFLQLMAIILAMSCKKNSNTTPGGNDQQVNFVSSGNTTYYVSSSSGSDLNSGKSKLTPWKTLTKVSHGTFASGDSILLCAGNSWMGESLTLNGNGTAQSPVILASYGTGLKPEISPGIVDEACIKLSNVAGWKILNLDLSNAKEGIKAEYDQVYNKDFLWIENCNIHDIDDTYNSQPGLYNHFSCGVVINGYTPSGSGRLVSLTNFTLKNCTFKNCNIGFNGIGTIFSHCDPTTGFATGDLVQLKSFTIQNCTVDNGSQGAMSLVSCANGNISNITTNLIGGGVYTYGVAALVAGYSQSLVFDSCKMSNTTRGPQNYDGDGFDFEGGLAPDGTPEHDITLKNSIIDFTDGCGVFVFNNGTIGRESKNCVINNVTISHFGVNVGNTKGAIYFVSGTTGTVSNCVFNRSVLANPYLEGDYSGFTLSNNSYN